MLPESLAAKAGGKGPLEPTQHSLPSGVPAACQQVRGSREPVHALASWLLSLFSFFLKYLIWMHVNSTLRPA